MWPRILVRCVKSVKSGLRCAVAAATVACGYVASMSSVSCSQVLELLLQGLQHGSVWFGADVFGVWAASPGDPSSCKMHPPCLRSIRFLDRLLCRRMDEGEWIMEGFMLAADVNI